MSDKEWYLLEIVKFILNIKSERVIRRIYIVARTAFKLAQEESGVAK